MKALTRILCFLLASFATNSSLWADHIISPKTEYVFIGVPKKIQLANGMGHANVWSEKIKLEDGIDLSGKSLKGVSIQWGEGTLKNVNFSKSWLPEADFSQTGFENCDFSDAKLDGAVFDGRVFGCNFTDATISRAHLTGFLREQLESTRNCSHLKDLSRCSFAYCDFSGINFSNFDLSYAKFDSTWVKDCDFTDARIAGIQFLNYAWGGMPITQKPKIEQLLSTKDFKEGFVKNIYVTDMVWPDHVVDLSNMVFIDCHFGWMIFPFTTNGGLPDYEAVKKLPDSAFAKIDLTDSVISGCNFKYFLGLTLENVKSTWNYKHGRMEGILLPEEIQQALDTEKGE